MGKEKGKLMYFTSVCNAYGMATDKGVGFWRDSQTEEEIMEIARNTARELSMKYTDVLFVRIHKGYKRLDGGEIAGDPFGYYNISSKTKGETMRARRLACGKNLEVNEYTDIAPVIGEKKEDCKTTVMMNIVKLDKNGNLERTLEQYASVEEARRAAEECVDHWIMINNLTTDEEEAKSHSHIGLCIKEDYGNVLEVRSIRNIQEISILIKEFERQ